MEENYYSSNMAEPNALELVDDLKENVSLKINGAEIHRILNYQLHRGPLSHLVLKIAVSHIEKYKKLQQMNCKNLLIQKKIIQILI